MVITLESVKNNPAVIDYLKIGNTYIGNMGALEHNLHHAELISFLTKDILATLEHPEREAELGAIAGYLHDIGNLVNRYGHWYVRSHDCFSYSSGYRNGTARNCAYYGGYW